MHAKSMIEETIVQPNTILQSLKTQKNPRTNMQGFNRWALTDSNRRPSACKADALNQLS